MKRIFFTFLLSISLLSAVAQIEKLAGPRVGVTMITSGSLASVIRGDVPFFSDEVRQEWTGSTGKYGAAISQYGWQWETRFSDGGNVIGIVEWIALVGGMEKGMFLPSVSSMVGLRTASGFEFAAGPNLSLGGIAMVIGIGKTLKFGKLNLPVNIAYVPSMNKTYSNSGEYYEEVDENGDIQGYEPKYTVTHPTGARISVMVGFNLGK